MRLVRDGVSLRVLLGDAKSVALSFSESIEVSDAVSLKIDQWRVFFRGHFLHGLREGKQIGVNSAICFVIAAA